MTDELVERIALRVRHNAAMDVVQTVATADQRISLLADVIWPSPRLRDASHEAALEILVRRRARVVTIRRSGRAA